MDFNATAFAIGMLLALSVSLAATWVGFDRDRSLYPVMTVVIASFYGLFAVMGGSTSTLLLETVAASVFVAAAVWAFKRSLWLAVLALAGHGLFDLFHGHIIADPGVPAWWPMFCASYDVVAALYLAWLLHRQRLAARVNPA